ncbi:MAG: PqqD family protein [Anaerolineales bacterium]|nr:PqqD family protein [Anaerolineales bacterium]
MAEQELAGLVYRHSPDVVARTIAGEVLLVPIRRNIGDLESIFTLNETAALVWNQLDGERSAVEVLEQVLASYEIEARQAESDLRDLLVELESIGAVEKA